MRRFLSLLAAACLLLTLAAPAAVAEDGAVAIWPIIQAPVGAERTYLVRKRVELSLLERTGLFLLTPVEVPDLGGETAHIVTLKVLKPDEQGQTRVHVTAYPVNPQTLRPIVEAPTGGVYILTHEMALSEETGEPGADFSQLFVWGHVPEGDAYAPMQPGDVRRVRVDVERFTTLLMAGFAPAAVDIARPTLQLVGWETVDGTGLWAARVRQTGVLTMNTVYEDEVNMSLAFPTTTDVLLVPGDFPWSVLSTAEGEYRVELLPNVIPGLTGAVRFAVRYESAAEPAGPYTLPAITTLEAGDAVTASLGHDGWDLGDGSPATVYAFEGTAGERVRITLQSREFDAYLLLADDAWNLIAEDDDSAGGTDARLIVELPATGRYFIIANALYADEAGRYTLSLESLGRAVDEEALLQSLGQAVTDLEQALADRDWNGALSTLEEALAVTRSHLPLTVDAVTLVTDRPNGFGEYTVRPHNVYRPGESVYVYLEPVNFHTREVDDRSELHLTVDAQLVDAAGDVVASFPNVVVWNRLTARPLRDVYLAVPLLIGQAAPGDYVWRLTVRDAVSGQAATVEVPIVVAAAGNARA